VRFAEAGSESRPQQWLVSVALGRHSQFQQRCNTSVRSRVRPDLSVVAVEGSKAFGASQNMPPAIAIDDDGREVTLGAEARA
jgi:hypothetical protein